MLRYTTLVCSLLALFYGFNMYSKYSESAWFGSPAPSLVSKSIDWGYPACRDMKCCVRLLNNCKYTCAENTLCDAKDCQKTYAKCYGLSLSEMPDEGF